MMNQIAKFIALSARRSPRRQCLVRRLVIGAAILTSLATGMGCATQTQPAVGYRTMNVDHARDLAFRYRGEGLALSKLADSLELEANSLTAQSQHSGSTTVADSRIHDLRKHAEAAFEQARRYREQIPHNQIY